MARALRAFSLPTLSAIYWSYSRSLQQTMSNENTRPSLMNMKHAVFAKTIKGKNEKAILMLQTTERVHVQKWDRLLGKFSSILKTNVLFPYAIQSGQIYINSTQIYTWHKFDIESVICKFCRLQLPYIIGIKRKSFQGSWAFLVLASKKRYVI